MSDKKYSFLKNSNSIINVLSFKNKETNKIEKYMIYFYYQDRFVSVDNTEDWDLDESMYIKEIVNINQIFPLDNVFINIYYVNAEEVLLYNEKFEDTDSSSSSNNSGTVEFYNFFKKELYNFISYEDFLRKISNIMYEINCKYKEENVPIKIDIVSEWSSPRLLAFGKNIKLNKEKKIENDIELEAEAEKLNKILIKQNNKKK